MDEPRLPLAIEQKPGDCRPETHRIIVALRKQGFTVYRQGKNFSVNGSIASVKQLKAIAGHETPPSLNPRKENTPWQARKA